MGFEVRTTKEFADWLEALKDIVAREAVLERLIRVRRGNFGDHKAVGSGVSELRIRHSAGFRAYYTIRGRTIIFMLIGGTKRTQDRDIAKAKQLAREI